MNQRQKQRRIELIITVIILVIIIVMTVVKLYSVNGTLTVWFFDVGQADSIYIDFPNGENMLIDAGNMADGPKIADWLYERNVMDIDYLVATHPHEDHIGGMCEIFYAFNVKNYYSPYLDRSDIPATRCYNNLVAAVKNEGCTNTVLCAGDILIDRKDIKLTCISPQKKAYNGLNRYSVALSLCFGNNSFLLMGDAESENEREILNNGFAFDCNVLKVGHHGSTTSSSEKFINCVLPEYAVISVGEDNKYHLPSDRTLKRLKNQYADILCTKDCGSIKMTCNGRKISTETYKLCLDGDR